MKYFIDFEAMQFSNYIISIGCVREDGDTFYSLVKPASKDNNKISKFISDLTGITNDMLINAPEADKVFEQFFSWVELQSVASGETPEFYCYGNCDTDFILANLNKSNCFFAKMILSYMYANMKDYAPVVKEHFGLVKLIGLAKVADYYRGEEIKQDHNALSDAQLLKYVYEQVHSHTMDEDMGAFPEYEDQSIANVIKRPNVIYNVTRISKNGEETQYKSLIKAAKDLIETSKSLKKTTTAKKENIAKKIKRAAIGGFEYQDYTWKIEVKD